MELWRFDVRKVLSLFMLLLVSMGCGKTIKKNQLRGEAFGTYFNIIYLTDEPVDYEREIDSVVVAVNKSLSTYIPDSDISKINDGETNLVVDSMFTEVFDISSEVYNATDGYFDPTVGTLVNAWGFGPGESIPMDSVVVDSLMQFVGFNKVHLTHDHQVVKDSPSIYFDFNAIAKGYAIDRLAKMLDHKGVGNYLVEVGGEVVAKGSNLIKQKPWVVGIDDPQAEGERKLKLLIELKDQALASSGNYRKYRIDSVTHQKFVHTIDPKTGFTKNSNTLAVTILANTCATADAYATAFMAMDLDKAFKVISNNPSLEAYIVYLNEVGKTEEFLTKGFREIVIKP